MVAIAIPSSCIGPQSVYSLQQATYALYEIARACSHFKVDEIIIYESYLKSETTGEENTAKKITFNDEQPVAPVATPKNKNSWELTTATEILQFLVTPAHLRKQVFGDLKPFIHAAKLPRLPGFVPKDSKHVRGISVKREAIKKAGKKSKKELAYGRATKFVNLGLDHFFELETEIPVHSMVTIDLKTKTVVQDPGNKTYTVRSVENFSKIFIESTVEGGYSHTFYVPCQEFETKRVELEINQSKASEISNAKQPLIVFGTWKEVSTAVERDSALEVAANNLFDGLLAGCESTRIEDAVMISLAKSDI